MMELMLEVELDTQRPDELAKLCELVREGWDIARVDKEVTQDRANKDIKFILLRDRFKCVL